MNKSNVDFAVIASRNVSIKDTIVLVNEVRLTYVGSKTLFYVVCIAMLLCASYWLVPIQY